MALRIEELAKTIDHTLLRPDATRTDIEQLCEDAVKHHFAAVNVFPYYVPLAATLLKSHDVKVCTVISFPFGGDTTRTKIRSAENAVGIGADEVEFVLNTGAMLSGNFRQVRDEIVSVVRAVRMKSVNVGKGLVLVKVILESSYLDKKLKKLACRMIEDGGADFVKTATGFGPEGATVADIELLRDELSESLGVKAAGGIRTAEDAETMINAGAARIGTSHAVDIMNEFAEHRE
ncbi:MAG: deoxyribose-phosphate aldolase [Thermoleophilia bacterium]|nr:deoxyribose-phosphate aldolase [Thermoleophilia bacterium]